MEKIISIINHPLHHAWLHNATSGSRIGFEGEYKMPTLHVRSVPEDLYERVRQLAQLRSRSLGAQVVTMLYEALDEEEQRKDQAHVLTSIRRRRFAPPENAASSLDLLREDRHR
jgi:plasmid stability protein